MEPRFLAAFKAGFVARKKGAADATPDYGWGGVGVNKRIHWKYGYAAADVAPDLDVLSIEAITDYLRRVFAAEEAEIAARATKLL